MHYQLLLFIALCLNAIFQSNSELLKPDIWYVPGNYNIAIMGYLRGSNHNGKCQNYYRRSPYVITELLRNLTEEFNIKYSNLNVKLGFIYIDTCLSSKRTVTLMFKHLTYHGDPNPGEKVPIIGAISALTATDTALLSYYLQPYKIPVLVVESVLGQLLNRKLHPYLIKLGPTTKEVISGFTSIIKHFNWSYVGILHENSIESSVLKSQLATNLLRNDICSVPTVIKARRIKKQMDKFFKTINTNMKVIILLLHYDQMREVVNYLNQNNKSNVFIVSKVITMSCVKCIRLNVFTEVSKFKKHFKQMTYNDIKQNPWSKQYLSNIFNCNFTNGNCDKYKTKKFSESSRSLVTKYLFKTEMGIKTLINALLNAIKVDKSIQNGLHKFIKSSKFQISTYNKNITISFQKNGFLKLLMKVEYFQKKIGTLIGYFKQSFGKIKFKKESMNLKLPQSFCSKDCKIGFHKRYIDKCCWLCSKCSPNSIVGWNDSYCEACPHLHWPNTSNYKECLLLSFNDFTDHPNAVIFNGVICSLGLLLTIICGMSFLFLRQHKLIKATSLPLSLFMLYIVMLIFIQLLLFNIEVTDTLCKVRQIGMPILYSCLYSTLLAKTIRIINIFRASEKFQRPKFAGSTSMIAIIGLLVLIQMLMLITLMMGHAAPRVQRWMPSLLRPEASMDCNMDKLCFFMPCAYNTLLILATVLGALHTRQLPDNFRETLCILLASGGTLLLWLCFFPLYAVIPPLWFRTLTELILFQISSFIFLVFLFGTKLFAIFFTSSQSSNDQSGSKLTSPSNTFKFNENNNDKSNVVPLNQTVAT